MIIFKGALTVENRPINYSGLAYKRAHSEGAWAWARSGIFSYNSIDVSRS